MSLNFGPNTSIGTPPTPPTPEQTERIKVVLGLDNVDNISLSSWSGSTNLRLSASQIVDFDSSVQEFVEVQSVAGRTGSIILSSGDISGLGEAAVLDPSDIVTVSSVSAVLTENVVESKVGYPDYYVLAIGQSNMQRGGAGGPTNYYGQASYDNDNAPNVLILNDAGEWAVYDLSDTDLSSHLGNNNPANTSNSSTIPYHFAKEFVRKTNSRVKIAGAALDGVSLDYWGINVAGTVHTPSATGWVRILSCLTKMPRVDAILFHQGEARNGRTQAQQLAGMKLLFNTIIATGKATNDTPILLGELLLQDLEVSNLSMKELVADPTWPQTKFITSPGYPGLDSVHFTDDQIRNFGHEYCRRLLKESVYIREVSDFDYPIGRFQSSYSTNNQTRYRIPLSYSTTGVSVRQRFRVQLAQVLIGNRPLVEFDVIVHLSGNGQTWTVFIQSGNSNGSMGASVELVDQTSTEADLLIHFVNPTAGGSGWAGSVIKVRDYFGTECAEISGDFTIGTMSVEAEVGASYLAGGSAVDMVNPPVQGTILNTGSILYQAYGTNYRKYRLAVAGVGSGSPVLSRFRFEMSAVELSTIGMRGISADILVTRWGGHSEYNVNSSGIKSNIGIKTEIENETTTSFDIVVHVCYPVGSATSFEYYAKAGISPSLGFDALYTSIIAGTASVTFTQEAEANALYQPGGAGVADF